MATMDIGCLEERRQSIYISPSGNTTTEISPCVYNNTKRMHLLCHLFAYHSENQLVKLQCQSEMRKQQEKNVKIIKFVSLSSEASDGGDGGGGDFGGSDFGSCGCDGTMPATTAAALLIATHSRGTAVLEHFYQIYGIE